MARMAASTRKKQEKQARIEDYAMIGDCRTAAIIGRDGSIDWLCLPRFDADACFAALLGERGNGRWLLAPAARYTTRRRYLGESLILETTFETSTGKARLIDFMPPNTADCTVVRIVEGISGHVNMATELLIRFDYGVTVPWVERMDRKTITAVAGPHRITVRTAVELQGQNMHTVGRFRVHAGEKVPFAFTYNRSFHPQPLAIDADIALEETENFWSGWAAKCNVQGTWRREVMRSLLTLKGLSYAPSGGIVAAATTSLPESLGGTRNWDYRFCWLRDATFTLLAFLNAGYTDEASGWQTWLTRAVAGAPDQMQPMYTVEGDRRLDEIEIPHLPGFAGSRPVRIGNAAARQLQLDVFGELADVMSQARKAGLPGSVHRAGLRQVALKHLEGIWHEPDEGIWEIRGEPRHFVHSKVMAWVAFDRAAQSDAPARDRARYRRLADKVHAEICAKGLDPECGCFVQAYGNPHLDASLLLLPMVGFLPATDRRMKATVRQIEKRLIHNGLVQRYETATGVDGLPPGEGAFLACSFWLVDNYRLQGRRAEAMALYTRLARLANDVGLMAEEYDPVAKQMLGNFPQAFSHVALVNSAIGLMQGQHAAPRRRASAGGSNGGTTSREEGAGRVIVRPSESR